MPQLQGIRIQNYRSLADVTLGQVVFNEGEPLPSLICFIGPNGSGKSTLLDAFAFLADCLLHGVESACDRPHRGGFHRLRTQGRNEPIRFDLCFQSSPERVPFLYQIEITEEKGVPVVRSEAGLQPQIGDVQQFPKPFFLRVKNQITAFKKYSREGDRGEEENIELADPGRLAITTLGQLINHPRIVALRKYIESWYLSYFVPEAARELPSAGVQKQLNRTGSNLGNVVQYLKRMHPDRFDAILGRIRERIPGIVNISHEVSSDNRLLLKFNERGYEDPFYQYGMSDGTLKMFAYLLLLEDPEPPALIGIEEPENGLYHKLLEQLAREFRIHAESSHDRLQILVTTHSPYFIDAMAPEQVWLMEKNEQGHSTVTRTADMPRVKDLQREGIPLGSLWYSNEFDERWSL